MPHRAYKNPQRIPPTVSGVITEKIEISKEYGTLIYCKGEKFPVKGRLLDQELLLDVDTFKKFIKGFIRIISFHPILEFFYVISEICTQRLAPHFLDESIYYDSATKEIMRAGMVAFGGVRVRGTDIGTNLVEGIGCTFNADRPYRYRTQDVLQERNLKNWTPYEVYRLIALLAKRDGQRSWKGIGLLIMLYLVVSPNPRKRVRKFLQELDISKLYYDDADLYFWLRNDDNNFGYNVMGMMKEERMNLWKKINDS